MHQPLSVDKVFYALADPRRRQILNHISSQGPRSASTMAQELPISRQAIAKHMGILEAAGLVSQKKASKQILYCVEPQQLAATGRWLQRTANRWSLSAE